VKISGEVRKIKKRTSRAAPLITSGAARSSKMTNEEIINTAGENKGSLSFRYRACKMYID